MPIIIDNRRGEKLAKLLYESFSTKGIHGRTDMPEDVLPKGISKGSLEHIIFITLTVAIDYQRDALSLWKSARTTFEDPEINYLFNPKSLQEIAPQKIAKDMQKHKLSKKPKKDAYIWRTIGITLFKKWCGDPKKFLHDCNWHADIILNRLKSDDHLYNKRFVSDYPFLRGDKIGPLWLRMLRDNASLSNLRNLDKVPIPVDIHVARATLATGVVRGEFRGKLTDLFETIRRAWFESVKELEVNNRPMIALDVDEPLWHLSKYGCTNRNNTTGDCPVSIRCEAKEFCIKGSIKIEKNFVELEI